MVSVSLVGLPSAWEEKGAALVPTSLGRLAWISSSVWNSRRWTRKEVRRCRGACGGWTVREMPSAGKLSVMNLPYLLLTALQRRKERRRSADWSPPRLRRHLNAPMQHVLERAAPGQRNILGCSPLTALRR